jgi:hypothetical protein
MDLRDPWSQQERLPEAIASPLWLMLAAFHERRCVRAASLVVMNTEVARDRMRGRYPASTERIISVMNGFDDDPLPPPVDSGPFVMAYAGSIYLDRSPRMLFRAAGRIIRELGLTPAEFRVELMGAVEQYGGAPLEAIAAQEGVEGHLRLLPPGSRAEAQQFLARSQMLVSLPQDSDSAIPSKVFEYLRFPAWILIMAEPESATERALRGTSASVVRPDDVDEMARLIGAYYALYRATGRPAPAAVDSRLSRKTQAADFFEVLERIVAGLGQKGTHRLPEA